MIKVQHKHIIWDWNGTLLNDVWLCVELTNRELLNAGLSPITVNDYRSKIGHPVKDFYLNQGLVVDDLQFGELAERFLVWYHERIAECNLQINAKDILASFSSQGKKQHILSAHFHESLIEVIDFFQVQDHFDTVNGLGEKTAAGKVELGAKLMKELECDRNEVILIGDTDHDAQVAKALDIDCILVSHGYQPRERLEGRGYVVIDELRQIQ